jgi:hypothetical protein
MGTDRTTGDGGAITGIGVVSVGPIIRRDPYASYAFVEGADLWWGESRSTGLETAWGDIEVYEASDEIMLTELAGLAANLTDGRDTETIVVKFQDPLLVPGVDYKIGDVVRLVLGSDVVPDGSYRVVAIDVLSGEPSPVFQVQFATVVP